MMNGPFLLLMVFSQLIFPATADNWAVLIAGSNYFFNYRHQSDICHAYQILTKKGGIPPENIIVMMYDDIAHNQENPFPGKIFNKPNGTNVYEGVKIDYRGKSVNKTTFLKVLKGDESAGGKVLKSTSEDDVFIYYSDHGATGLVAMPVGDVLYANELMDALKFMHANKMYRQLVFYMEACESGSMFDGLLPKNLNIFATTAANPQESSYAYYYWQPVGTYLGDEYSIRWLEDSDANLKKGESLKMQFEHVVSQVKQSHPQMYGTTAWENEPLKDFQGDETSLGVRRVQNEARTRQGMSISSRDVKLFYLMQKYSRESGTKKAEFREKLQEELRYRSSLEEYTKAVVSAVLRQSNMAITVEKFMSEYKAPRNFACLKMVKDTFSASCEPLVEYGMKFVKNLVQLCESFSCDVIVRSIKQVCVRRKDEWDSMKIRGDEF